MAFYEGQNLRDKIAEGPLRLGEAVEIALQLAEGLARAHEAGVVHRDLKSSNIIITNDGTAKIVDFGLAKLGGQTKLTKTGSTLGTVAYMSPEQVRGEEADDRSDLWSLGVTLYEMITGRLPFQGEQQQAMMRATLEDEPEPVTGLRTGVPLELERIVSKCLQKDPDERYQTAQDLAADLRHHQRTAAAPTVPHRPPSEETTRLAAPRPLWRTRSFRYGVVAVLLAILIVGLTQLLDRPGAEIDSIAVLPLENLTGDPDQEYFSDGMTDVLITELSKIRALRVISKQSAMRYKQTDKTLPEIAEELSVDAVVEGSVFRDGDRVMINAQLIGTAPERHLWADKYERDFGDVLAMFSEVAQAIAGEIQATVTPEEQAQLATVRPVDPEAYDLVLRGDYHFEKFLLKKGEAKKAAEYYQKAIEIDPNYAHAHARIADCYVFFGWGGDLPIEEARSIAMESARKALEIDDQLSQGHYALANIRFYLDWDWVGAEEEYRRSIALDPNFAWAHGEYGWFLTAMGRFEEAFDESKLFLQLAPVSWIAHNPLARWYVCTRQYDQALAQYRLMAEMEPDKPPVGVWTVYEQMGRYEDAIKVRTLWGGQPERATALDSAYSESGPEGYWKVLLERSKGQQDRNPGLAAWYHVQLGEKDQAFAWLEKAYETHSGGMHQLKVEPAWDPLRDDPRFQDLLRRMNFPE
jgi:TolB-like protein